MILLLLTGSLSSASVDSEDINQFDNITIINETSYETLPEALPQIGAQPRNYVAYIPVPISDDEDDEEYEDEEDYEDDDYYEDEDEYYYDEDEEEYRPPPKRLLKHHSFASAHDGQFSTGT